MRRSSDRREDCAATPMKPCRPSPRDHARTAQDRLLQRQLFRNPHTRIERAARSEKAGVSDGPRVEPHLRDQLVDAGKEPLFAHEAQIAQRQFATVYRFSKIA